MPATTATDAAGLRLVRATDFRCLESVEFELDPAVNLVVGPNGSGKTSLLEAMYYLGRTRSFRAPRTSALIRDGAEQLTVFGECCFDGAQHRLGIRTGRGGTEIHIDGEPAQAAELAAALPVQILEPEVHQLVQGGPERRRQFLDWGVFHVKHSFLTNWRRYRRCLRQRNAALRAGAPRSAVVAWDPELLESAAEIDAQRRAYLDIFRPALSGLAQTLAGFDVECRYEAGWRADSSFESALHDGWDRDRALGSTQAGPHRAELRLMVDGEAARHRISRGQQKLLGAALVIAQSCHVSEMLGRPTLLLVDEPAAELDTDHLARLTAVLSATRLQLVLSTLDAAALPGLPTAKTFHVEHATLTNLL